MRYRCATLILVLVLTGVLCACRQRTGFRATNPLDRAYGQEQDPNDAYKWIPLNYQQAQGKRVFDDKCVWCHADATPAGPSNRGNLTPQPPLFSDASVMNTLSDDFIRNIVSLGGSAVGKSSMMPPWGQTLSREDIQDVIAYIRVVAQPPKQADLVLSRDFGGH